MQLHEYQAKYILKRFKVPVPFGQVASSDLECEKIASLIKGKCVIKAQVHSGGRGKAGGIKIASDPVEAKKIAQEMIGNKLKTSQSISWADLEKDVRRADIIDKLNTIEK